MKPKPSTINHRNLSSMRFKKIVIENYKAITKPIEIDFSKQALIPIIGINECGKTTILNAIFAFDRFNDKYNDKIRQLTDVINLYDTKNNSAKISALIEIKNDKIVEYLKIIRGKGARTKISPAINELRILRTLDGLSNSYSCVIPGFNFKDAEENDKFCDKVVKNLPYILYFDDFKDSFPEKIEIKKASDNNWLETIEQLFEQTDKDLSIYDLPLLEERKRKSTLSKVTKKLNETLTEQWSNFKLDNKDALQISIDFEEKDANHYLKFEIIEKDEEGNEHYFYIRDRSKGFYWFFNFVMKLEFNPKTSGSDDNAIYLLDEPGSYLHPFAQQKLCKKLKSLSKHHKIIYCTHTHYLLDPEIIPLSSIRIANKKSNGSVSLEVYNDFPTKGKSADTAFKPIYDALELQPLSIEFKSGKFLLVEGIYDYYSFNLFKSEEYLDVSVMPCKGADSMINFVSLMIGLQLKFQILWDNDEEGRKKYGEAERFFGEDIARKHFNLLPSEKDNPKLITQAIFNGDDLKMFKKELSLPDNARYEKVIASLYYSDLRKEIIKLTSDTTKNAFKNVYRSLKF